MILIATVLYIRAIVYPIRKVVFDRMNGTVSMPGQWGIFPRHSISFSDVHIGIYYGTMMFPYSKYIPIPIQVWHKHDNEVWYVFLQYMDKNYPLPCGTAFDPYREQDFKRRQSEGFPKPTCKSLVWLTDESCGYLRASDAIKARISKFKKVSIGKAYQYVQEVIYSLADKIMIQESSEIALVGIYENNYVFKLFDEFHGEIIEYKENMLSNCFLVSGTSKNKVEYIPHKQN